MSTQFNQSGQVVHRGARYDDGPVVGGYPVEAGAEQLGLFGGRPKTVKVKGYRVKGYNRRRPESGALSYYDAEESAESDWWDQAVAKAVKLTDELKASERKKIQEELQNLDASERDKIAEIIKKTSKSTSKTSKSKAPQKKTVLAGTFQTGRRPGQSYAWIPWTLGMVALVYWLASTKGR